jgi:cell division inhibitor SepF
MEAQSDIVEPAHFDDAKLLADRIRDRVPVVLNMRNTEPDMVRRLVDFCTGLTYALDGSMRKIDEGVILVLPPRVSLGREEKRRLADLGLYAVGDEQT